MEGCGGELPYQFLLVFLLLHSHRLKHLVLFFHLIYMPFHLLFSVWHNNSLLHPTIFRKVLISACL